MEEFVKKDNYNTAGRLVPQDIQSGEEIYCGFHFKSEGETYKILIYGTTTRGLGNSDKEPTRITAPLGGE